MRKCLRGSVYTIFLSGYVTFFRIKTVLDCRTNCRESLIVIRTLAQSLNPGAGLWFGSWLQLQERNKLCISYHQEN